MLNSSSLYHTLATMFYGTDPIIFVPHTLMWDLLSSVSDVNHNSISTNNDLLADDFAVHQQERQKRNEFFISKESYHYCLYMTSKCIKHALIF